MSDIRIPPESVGLRLNTGGTSSYIVNAQKAIQQMASGKTIEGQVIGRNSQGLTEIMTQFGLLQLQTNQAMIAGKLVSITIQQQGAIPQVLLQTIVKNPEDKKTQSTQTSDIVKTFNAMNAASSLQDTPALPVVGGMRIPATFLQMGHEDSAPTSVKSALPQSVAVAAEPEIIQGKVISGDNGKWMVATPMGSVEIESPVPLQIGSNVPIQVLRPAQSNAAQPQAPLPNPSQSFSPIPQTVPQSSTPPQMPAPNKIVPDQPQPLQQTQNPQSQNPLPNPAMPQPNPIAAQMIPDEKPTVQFRLAPNPQPAPMAEGALNVYKTAAQTTPVPRPALVNILPLGTQQPEAVKSEVIYVSPQQVPTLRTPQGLITFNAPYLVHVGDEFMLDIQFPRSKPTAAAAVSTETAPPIGGRGLVAMPMIADFIQKNPDSPVVMFLRNALIGEDGKIGNQILLYFAAIMGGDARFWIGQKLARALEKDSPASLEKLSEEFTSLQKSTDDNNTVWRHVPFPVMDGRQFNHIHFYFKNHGEQDSTEAGQRFVIETNMSQLGNMQLDGFIRRDHFDLVLRSNLRLPPTVEQDIRTIFKDYMDIAGWQGQISFQTVADFPVKPMAENSQDSSHLQTRI